MQRQMLKPQPISLLIQKISSAIQQGDFYAEDLLCKAFPFCENCPIHLFENRKCSAEDSVYFQTAWDWAVKGMTDEAYTKKRVKYFKELQKFLKNDK